MNNETQTLWFSRASFAFSVLALGSFIHSGCQDAKLSAEPKTTLMRVTEVAGDDPAEAPPKPSKKVPPNQEETQAQTPKDKQVKAEKPSKKADEPRDESGPEGEAAPLKLKRLVVTEEVENREPKAALQDADPTKPVFAFVEVQSGDGQAQEVTVTFEHESGKKVGFVKLGVPADKSRWRTWGKTRMVKQPGKWTAVVTTESGEVLGSQEFSVAGL